jgi:hypothetical protein
MAGNGTVNVITDMYAIFADMGPRAIILAPLVSNEELKEICNFPSPRRERFFRSHCFFLPKDIISDNSVTSMRSVQGQVVQIVRGEDGIRELFHLGTRVRVVSHVQTTNGNHILRIQGMLYPYMKAVLTERDLAWSPWMFMLNFHECSNMVAAFTESGVYDEYIKNLVQPFTLFLPRNDTFTASQLDWLLNSTTRGELRVFVKRHIVEGYVQVDKRKYCRVLEKDMATIDQIETKSMDQLFISAKQVDQTILPFISIAEEGEVTTSAHCMEIYSLMRGIIVIIDSPLYDFEGKRTVASQM